MAEYKEARNAYRKTGAAHATGDGLRYLYAELIPMRCGLRKRTTKTVYEHLCGFEKDDEIKEEAHSILQNPSRCFEFI